MKNDDYRIWSDASVYFFPICESLNVNVVAFYVKGTG